MVAIKSTSPEGTYYLVNGWEKHKAFWSKWLDPVKCGFKTAGLAKRSLRHLLEIMPEYAEDKIDIVEA